MYGIKNPHDAVIQFTIALTVCFGNPCWSTSLCGSATWLLPLLLCVAALWAAAAAAWAAAAGPHLPLDAVQELLEAGALRHLDLVQWLFQIAV